MSPTKLFTRREVLKTAALGAVALPFLTQAARSAEPPAAKKKVGGGRVGLARENGIRLGVASISLVNLSLDEAIAVLKEMGIVNVNVFRKHLNLEEASVDECKAVNAKLKAAGMVFNSTGVTNLPNNEAKIRKAFENAKAVNMPVLVCKPDVPALPLIDKLVKEYDLKLAIHNHGPEDKVYPSPYDAWKAVQSFDSRIGLCIDVSHTLRIGDKPDEAIRKCASRLYDVHIKDTKAGKGAMEDIPVEQGGGNIDTRAILTALLAIKYPGVLTYEYEQTTGNPLIGLSESLGYLRGMLKALS
jgi:inosose dehydratase